MPIKSKFLFSLQSRSEYLKSIGFLGIHKTDKKHKVTVRREHILEDAIRILEDVNTSLETFLEIEYFDEVGTGLGPTVEFFNLVSQEIKNLKL